MTKRLKINYRIIKVQLNQLKRISIRFEIELNDNDPKRSIYFIQ